MNTTATDPHIFDPTHYDLEGTPTVNGQKAHTVTIALDNFELDTTDPNHMLLAGKLEQGDPMRLTIEIVHQPRITTNRKPTEHGTRLEYTYRITIEDIAGQP